VLLARTLMAAPDLLLLDEPCAGLDIGGRERLVGRLGALAREAGNPPMVMVTHHVEEIPTHFTHVLLVRAGSVVAAGPLAETLTEANLSACFGLELRLRCYEARWTCRAA
jgi:iron complex transport system ATP-binding protein